MGDEIVMPAPKVEPMGFKFCDFLAGTAGGIGQVLAGQPFDTLKVRLQSVPEPLPGQAPVYSGTLDCLRKTVAQEGAGALYKGSVLPLVTVGAMTAIQFSVYEFSRRNLLQSTGQSRPGFGGELLCGSAVGLVNGFFVAPVEHVRIRLQVQSSAAKEFAGPLDAIMKIGRQHGVFGGGLWRGYVASTIRETWGFAMYFAFYGTTMQFFDQRGMLRDVDGNPKTPMILLAGSAAGVMFWVPVFPVDVVKSKMQTDNLKSPKYNGFIGTFKKVFAEQGAKGLFKGLAPCALRAGPANAATFFCYERAQQYMRKNNLFGASK